MAERASSPRPTLAKVALLANVSKATASNALSGGGRVSAETTARVRAAALSLGYRTDLNARQLSIGRVPTIGMLAPSSVQQMVRQRESLFWLRLNDGFIGRCSDLGCAVTLIMDTRAQLLIDSGIDVLVLLGKHDADVVEQFDLPFGLPVLSGHDVGELKANIAQHNPKEVAETVMSHLLDIGRRHASWMPGNDFDQIPRWESELRNAAANAGIEFSMQSHDDSRQSADAAISRAVADGVDAIFGMFQYPETILGVLRERNVTVPEQLALIFQSEGLIERAVSPSITTLSLCGFRSGELLAEHAVTVAQAVSHEQRPLPIELTIRQSTTI